MTSGGLHDAERATRRKGAGGSGDFSWLPAGRKRHVPVGSEAARGRGVTRPRDAVTRRRDGSVTASLPADGWRRRDGGVSQSELCESR